MTILTIPTFLIAFILSAPSFATVPTTPPNAARSSLLRGDWPVSEPLISLDIDGWETREALKKLASQAHWSLSFRGKSKGLVFLSFQDIPADQALIEIIKDRNLYAERSGNRVTVAEISSSTFEKDSSIENQLDRSKHSDRVSLGKNISVRTGETITDAISVLGNVNIEGTVLQNTVSVGGNVILGPTAVVKGDVVSVGGSLEIDPEATVEGDRVTLSLSDLKLRGIENSIGSRPRSAWLSFAKNSIRFIALFVFCLLLCTFAPDRVGKIRQEICNTPGKSALIGTLCILAIVPLTLILILTVIGVALLPLVFLVIAAGFSIGFASLALEIGVRFPTKNVKRSQLLSLAIGTAALFLVHLLPVLGHLVLALAATISLGAALRTRFGSPFSCTHSFLSGWGEHP